MVVGRWRCCFHTVRDRTYRVIYERESGQVCFHISYGLDNWEMQHGLSPSAGRGGFSFFFGWQSRIETPENEDTLFGNGDTCKQIFLVEGLTYW